jgi:hypothetical protein
MVESRKTKRFVWVLSLTLGPIVYGILLLTLPGTPNIQAVKQNLIDLGVAITVYWAVGLGLVWGVYRLGKFILRYGPSA